jgi:hypothetical protein
MAAPDRKVALQAQSVVTGIDFVYVDATQVVLDVYFLNDPLGLTVSLANLTADQIQIYNAARNVPGQEVSVTGISWVVVGADNVLRIDTAEPGDFTLYKFGINDARVDRFFNHIPLNFKANCPSDLDCKQPPHECAPEDWVDFPVDYQARDFESFRQALTDFASLRYPNWTDRLEADAGMMLLEMMSAMGDEMSYYQDRVGREAHLETASERRSVRRHARLLDYDMHDGLGATTWLDVTVLPADSGQILAGHKVWAKSDGGETTMFEVGASLQDIIVEKEYFVEADRNSFDPHFWDEDEVCLPAGSTELYISGHHQGTLAPGSPNNADWLVLKTAESPGIPSKRHLVNIKEVVDDNDPVFGLPITRITWDIEYATPFEMDLEVLEVRGNIVPIMAGETFWERFIVGEDPDLVAMSDPDYGPLSRAVERAGPGDVTIYLYSLTDSDLRPLVWEGDQAVKASPAIHIYPVEFVDPNWDPLGTADWDWQRSLLGSPSSQPNDTDYTLDDGLWRRVVSYRRPDGLFIHQDYATGAGKTIRFGDGEFGIIPAEGTIFQLVYRLGNGVAGNVEPDVIKEFEAAYLDEAANPPRNFDMTFVESISNPFGATNGQDEESLSDVKALAPQAFRSVTFRAVRKEDYAEAAERLDWVQKAGAEFRWTGSWLTGFVTPDPLDTVVVRPEQNRELSAQMERFRQAGREIYPAKPIYANMDLEIDLCIEAHAYPLEVKARVMLALFGKGGPRPVEGYFSPDRFTFGTPLDRTTLEATMQLVPGVKAVEQIRYRRRGWFTWQVFTDFEYDPGDNVIIRISNDLLRPEQGTVKIFTHGGA